MIKNELQEIYRDIVAKSYNVIFHILNEEGIVFINKKISFYTLNVPINLFNKIEIDEFNKFLNTPQIKYLLTDCLSSLILSEFIKKEHRRIEIADNVVNYCLEVIERYYISISDNNCIKKIKIFFEYIFNARYITKTLKNNKEIYFKLYKDNYFDDEIYFDSIKRVDKELCITYRCNNLVFESIKDKCRNIIQQMNEQGFIYLVGEFQFNDFYISPILFTNNNIDSKNKIKYSQFNMFTQTMTKSVYEKIGEGWKNIFCSDDIVYVIGGPGSGKSLFLQNIINNYENLNIKNSQDFLLIYGDLRNFWFDKKDDIKSVEKFLMDSMTSIIGANDITYDFLQYFLNRGRCIILLDALDEVPKKARENVHGKIINYFSAFNPNNKICITSRDRGFIPKKDIKSFQIFPLIRYDIEEYLDKMILLKKFNKNHKIKFLEQAQVLIDKGFLNSFLVLSLLVNIFKAEKELPENKIELYKKCFDYISKKREEEKSKGYYDWTKINPLMKDSTFMVLSTLAVPNNNDIDREEIEFQLKKYYKRKYSNEAETENAINEFLNFCSNRTELIVPSATDNKFRFFHRSFFEYFYARHICQQSSVEEIYESINMFDIDSEIFELTVSLIKQENEIKYQDLLDYIFEQVEIDIVRDYPNFFPFCILTLVMQVVDDRYYIDKYYKIAVNHIDYMKNEKISIINQYLLQICLQKGIEDNYDRKKEFKNIYESECIKYILNLFSCTKKRNKSTINSTNNGTKKIDGELNDISDVEKYEGEILIEGEVSQIPFFVLVYQNYFDISEVVQTFREQIFAQLVNKKYHIIDKEKYKLITGAKKFFSYNEKDCKNFIQFYLNKKKFR